MKRFTLYFVEHKLLFWSLMVILALAGVACFTVMPKLEDPATEVRLANVVVPYPGATAHEVELEVAKPLENIIYGLPNIRHLNTTCQPGMALIQIEWQTKLTSKELEEAFLVLRKRLQDSHGTWPNGCYDPIVIDDIAEVYGIMFAITGDGYSNEELARYAKHIREELLLVDGVKRVHIAGIRPKQVNLTINRERLMTNGILPTQLMLALQNIGKPPYAGQYTLEEDRIALDIDADGTDEDAIRNLLITTVNGKVVHLGDVVDEVSIDYADPQTYGYFVEGKEALAVCIAMEEDAVVPNVGRRVEKAMQEITAQFPVGIDIQKAFYQPDLVSKAVGSFMINLAESVLIVLLVLTLFMGWRSGVIIGFGLILTVCGSFVVLHAWGATLHRISLGAFIVAMGMLVDNAVVIMDGIIVDRQKGLRREVFLTRIVKQTAWPLLGATLIAIFAFVSVVITKGLVAEYAADLFRVMAASLLVSWLLAIVQIPACADAWLKQPLNAAQGKSRLDQVTEHVHQHIRRILNHILGHKTLSFSVAVLLLGLSVVGFFGVRNIFFPDFEYNQLIVECFWPQSTSSNEVRDHLLQMTEEVRELDDVTLVTASQGCAPAHYCLVRPMTAGGDCYGELMVDFKDYKTLCHHLPTLRNQLRQNYPDAYIRIRKYNFSIATSHLIEAEFSGPDPAVLMQLADSAAAIMRQSPYIDAYSVQNNWAQKGQHLHFHFNEQNAQGAHLSRQDLSNSLQAATSGYPIGLFIREGEREIIYLHVREADGSQIEDLQTVPVWSALNMRPTEVNPAALLVSGLQPLQDQMFRCVPLSAVVDSVTLSYEQELLHRHNGRRAIEVEADVNPLHPKATADKAIGDIRQRIEQIPLPEGYHFRWLGDKGTTMEIVLDLLRKSLIGVAIMLLILLFLFHSWKKIGVMFLCVPFLAVGVVLTLLITDTPFTFMALLGVFGLFGMMLKNTVVLMDEIECQLQAGVAPYTAVIEATVSRTRPVLMASLTTIVGVIPLIGDPMYGSMAWTIMGGLLVGTMVTLLLLPLTYATVFRIKKVKTTQEPE